MRDGSVHFHVNPLLLIGRIRAFPVITETGKNTVAVITERIIIVDSRKSNAGEGEGYSSRTPGGLDAVCVARR